MPLGSGEPGGRPPLQPEPGGGADQQREMETAAHQRRDSNHRKVGT